MESLKGDGASDDIAREGFKGLGIGGMKVEIIIDAKAKVIPTMPPEYKRSK